MQGKLAKLSLFAITVVALASVQSLPAQQASGQARKLTQSSGGAAVYDNTQWSPDQDILLLKSNIRSQKKQIVAANMDLTDAEAEKFWPVYDRYASELAKTYDTKIALFQEYLETSETMSGDQAENYLRRRAAVEKDQMQLRLQYLPEFRKVLTGRKAALFYQIEWRLDLMINLQLAQAPMINP
jgi:Spy/CpxP family protein refolding chaperone